MNGIGTVQSVKNQPMKNGFFQIVMVNVDGYPETINMAYFGKEDIYATEGRRISLEWTEEPNGQYTRRNIKSFSLAPEALQPPVSATASQAYQPSANVGGNVIDQRQENINRQSAWNAATTLVAAALQDGLKIVGGDSKKAKDANKDPEVIFEATKYFAMKIKDHVQNGVWDSSSEPETIKEPTEPKEEVPF